MCPASFAHFMVGGRVTLRVPETRQNLESIEHFVRLHSSKSVESWIQFWDSRSSTELVMGIY